MAQPTQQDINRVTDELFFLTYTGGQRVKLTANDPRAHDWWSARHYVETNWDAIAANPNGALSDYASSMWASAAQAAPPLPQNVPAHFAPESTDPRIAVQGDVAATGDPTMLRQAALRDVMHRLLDHPSETAWAFIVTTIDGPDMGARLVPVTNLEEARHAINEAAGASTYGGPSLVYWAIVSHGRDGIGIAAESPSQTQTQTQTQTTSVAGHGGGGGGHGGGGHGGFGGRGWGGWGGWGGGVDYLYPYLYPPVVYPVPIAVPYEASMFGNENPTGIISGHRGYGPEFRLPERDRLRTVARAAYPLANGAQVHFDLEGNTLRASICIDGQCYNGEVDLSEILAQHGASTADAPMEPQAAQAAAADVQAAGSVMVGRLLDQHCDAVVGGWWHNLTHAIEKDVGGALKSTFNALKGPIEQAAQIAVQGLASSIPGVGPIASNLVGTMMKAATGSGSAKQAARAALAQAKQQAASNPQLQQAYAIAQQAVTQSTAAYHAAQTATNAASGNPDAQAQLQELQTAAQSGDQAATNLYNLLQQTTGGQVAASQQPGGQPATPAAAAQPPSSVPGGPTAPAQADPAALQAQQAQAAQQGVDPSQIQIDPSQVDPNAASNDGSVQPSDPSGTVATVSGVATTGRVSAKAAAQAEYAKSGAPAIGVVMQGNGRHMALGLESLDAADDWLGKLQPGTFTYAAYFDPQDPTWPEPINERVGAKVVSSGWLAPIIAAAGGFGLGAVGWPYVHDMFTEAKKKITGHGNATSFSGPK